MSTLHTQERAQAIEKLYETYSPMLYGMALQIAPSAKEAEKILLSTFVKLQKQKKILQGNCSLCVSLIRLLLQTAHEVLKPGDAESNFALIQFENFPVLQSALCKQAGLESYCETNNVSRAMALKKLREEFKLLWHFQTTNNQLTTA